MTIEKNGLKLEIKPVDYPTYPRDQGDELGIMVCFHRKYALGDKHEFANPDELHEFLKSKDVVAYLPLYLYDHSGITMSTTPFSCKWDSGQVGYIYTTKERMKYLGLEDYTEAKVKEMLENEVAEYDAHLTGEVYLFQVKDKDDEILDSCGGYIGSTTKILLENMRSNAERDHKFLFDELIKQNERKAVYM